MTDANKNFWLSWYHDQRFGEFELNSPWWISGYAWDHDDEELQTICAALRAKDENAVREKVYRSYDVRPAYLEFRFCELRDDDWIPWDVAPGEQVRFPKADWMIW